MACLRLLVVVFVCLATVAVLAGTATPTAEPSTSLVWTIESISPDISLATTPVGDWDRVALNPKERQALEGVEGINFVAKRCIVRFTLSNPTNRSYLVSHEDIHLALCRPTLTDGDGRKWVLKLNVRGHADGDVHGFPSIAGQTRAGRLLMMADLVRSEPPDGEVAPPYPKTLRYDVNTKVSGREVVGKKLKIAQPVPIKGTGTCSVDLSRAD
ncbi:MAG TPA: hypothetical protein VD997_15160 [Phycisphaerales bacterium]|nr:hypothetical protein [Phycisphaerales bacterium]